MNLVKHPDGRTKKILWFYIDEQSTVVSPYFYSESEAISWKESPENACTSEVINE
jgi:hypothetical protein